VEGHGSANLRVHRFIRSFRATGTCSGTSATPFRAYRLAQCRRRSRGPALKGASPRVRGIRPSRHDSRHPEVDRSGVDQHGIACAPAVCRMPLDCAQRRNVDQTRRRRTRRRVQRKTVRRWPRLGHAHLWKQPPSGSMLDPFGDVLTSRWNEGYRNAAPAPARTGVARLPRATEHSAALGRQAPPRRRRRG
jgi:hypothetical protein